MSDPHKDPTVEVKVDGEKAPSIEDFTGVLGWVERKKEESKKSGEPWGWLMALVAAVVVSISLAYAAYVAWKKGREIAELKHKIDVDEEKKIAAEADAKLATIEEESKKLEKEAKQLQEKIDSAKNDIRKLESDRLAVNTKIDKITSWEDVENLM